VCRKGWGGGKEWFMRPNIKNPLHKDVDEYAGFLRNYKQVNVQWKEPGSTLLKGGGGRN